MPGANVLCFVLVSFGNPLMVQQPPGVLNETINSTIDPEYFPLLSSVDGLSSAIDSLTRLWIIFMPFDFMLQGPKCRYVGRRVWDTDQSVVTWDVESGTQVSAMTGHVTSATAVAWRQDWLTRMQDDAKDDMVSSPLRGVGVVSCQMCWGHAGSWPESNCSCWLIKDEWAKFLNEAVIL